MKLTLQEKTVLVSFTYHATIISIAGGVSALGYSWPNQPLFDAGVFLILFHALSFRRLSIDRYIQQVLIRSHRCNVCGFNIPLTGTRWRCQCSFVSSPRSAFSP